MGEDCITFDLGKIKVNAKTDKYELNFDEHRKLCNEAGIFSFEFGTMMDKKKILVMGRSIKPEKNIKDYEFIVHTYLDGKRVGEQRIKYADVIDLFTRETCSHLLVEFAKKHHLRVPSAKKTITQKHLRSPAGKKKITHQQMRSKRQTPEKGKISFKPGKREGHVINPETGAEIKIDGPTYNDLCKTGKYICRQ
jgi:hypothetical protein